MRLVAASDVVFSNFKPGTMDSLGLGFDELQAVNPAIVAVDSSALGRTGPASRRMGYGPLVRARSGVTNLWRYPDDPDGFCDAITIYPDHTAARVGATAALAALIAARATGRGSAISIAQGGGDAHAVQGPSSCVSRLNPARSSPVGNSGEFDAPYGVYGCAGEDQWCVICVRDTDDWHRLCATIGADDLAADVDLGTATGRIEHREPIDERVRAWTAEHAPREVMATLQAAGVPAAAMARVPELLTDPHLVARGLFTRMHQPQLGELPTRRGPRRSTTSASRRPRQRAAAQ